MALSIGLYWVKTQENSLNRKISFLSTVSIFLVILSLSQPYIITDSQAQTEESVNIIADNTPSSQLINYNDLDDGETNINKVDVGSDTNYHIGNYLTPQIQDNTEYVVLSDFQTDNTDQIIEEANERNATINVLRGDIEPASSVFLEGPENTYPSVENTYLVHVETTRERNPPSPQVEVEGESVQLERISGNTWSFNHVFDDEGSYEIEADIAGDEEHSRYYKSVKVDEKPSLLYLGEENSLTIQLEDFFNIDYKQEIPNNQEDYRTVITTEESDFDQNLQNYVAEGNGLMHIGKTPSDTNMLPVHTYEPEDDSETFDSQRVSIVIDSSVSTEGDGLREAQKIALNLVDVLPDDTEAGLITYKEEAHEITPLQPLESNRNQLMTDITRLNSSGPTFHHTGIKGADQMLQGQGDIILITDGLLSQVNRDRGVPEDTIEAANQTERPITVIDRNTYVNPEFLQQIAELSGGQYISSDSGSMEFVFESRTTERQGQSIWTANEDHFITQDSSYTAYVQPYQTETRTGAETLISAGQNDYLVNWRYGLGRVAAITDTENDLAALMEQEPALVLRTLSWTVGDTEEGTTISSASRPNEITIRSEEVLNNSRYVDGKYERTETPDSLGFHEYEGILTSYNYHEDMQTIGYNQDIEQIAEQTGGKVYEQEELENSLNEVKTVETSVQTETMHLTNYVLTIAILLFLVTLWIRKRNRMK